MSENRSIKDTLSVIRKALEDDNINNDDESDNNDALILNHLVKDDGTIEILHATDTQQDKIKEILDKNINEYFDKWIENKMPDYLDKYIKKK